MSQEQYVPMTVDVDATLLIVPKACPAEDVVTLLLLPPLLPLSFSFSAK